MTKRRNDPDGISNYYDALLKGIGHRGSSFTDIDGFQESPRSAPPLYVTHNGAAERFLFFELKNEHEGFSNGQRWALRDLSKKPGCESWLIRKRPDDHELVLFRHGQQSLGSFSDIQLRDLFAYWWAAE